MNAHRPMTPRQYALARCDATGRNEHTSSLYAHCVTCEEIVYDWRRLLGVGALVAASTGDGRRARLTYPGGCGSCGGSELAVATLRTVAPDTLAGLLGRFVVETREGREAPDFVA
jgi:hypothetical protein